MSDSYEDPGDISALNDKEMQCIVSSLFCSTAIMSKMASDMCKDPDCEGHDGHEDFPVSVPFLELECYYEGGGSTQVFIPVQLLTGVIEAASRTLATLFPGHRTSDTSDLNIPDTLEGFES